MADDDESTEEKPKFKLPSPQIMLVVGNSLLVLTALATMVYTKLIYQRPPMNEETEIERQVEESKKPIEPTDHPLVTFDQMTVNIAMTSGKAHFATVTLALECRDGEAASLVGAKRAAITDKLIASLGKRQLTELNTIQGKLLLKTELLREFNTLTAAGSVTDLFFPTFVLQ
ncbi:MAG: flagellar basal body-associated FliL family protein [Deltaproteobacteria bacterium]|nr:flagellar basal body-associated FliL family protein [Deltaproteobacteria bacterium]